MLLRSISLSPPLPHATDSLLFHPAFASDCRKTSPAFVKCPFLRSFLCLASASRCSRAPPVESLVVRASADARGLPQSSASRDAKLASLFALKHLDGSGSERYTKEKTSILVVGLSVHTAPLEMRENLAIPEANLPTAIGELCQCPHIQEAAVLSTCNRMEIYVVALSWHMGVREVSQWMSKVSGIPLGKLREHLFVLQDQDATQHLFRVASGLDSLVLGEGQILAQVKQVLKRGQSAEGFGRTLSALFKQAITAGKRVRSETSIAAGAVSVSSAAVELAATKLPGSSFCNVNVVIIGAGKMAKLLVKHLISKGCTRMVVVNRTEERVQDLQSLFPEAVLLFQPFHEMMKCVGEADVVFTSTASQVPLFSKSMVECLPPAGAHVAGIRHFIDISVPRNVPTCVGELSSTHVHNVDDLREVVTANMEQRREKALEAQVIIGEEIMNFKALRGSWETVPTIKKLRAYAEKVRLGELQKCLSKMGDDLSKKDKKMVEELSRGIVNKLLHGPMTHLRCDDTDGRTAFETLENMHALERMFKLQSDTALEQQITKRQSE